MNSGVRFADMLQILLIRPGSTDYDLQRRIQGNLDIPLNAQGEAEVARMIDEFRTHQFVIDAIYAPECEPALQTAQAIAEAFHVKLRVLEEMRNLNQGLWQGMCIDEFRLQQPKVYRQWQEHPESVCPPEGEMLGEAAERVHAAMGRIFRKHKEGLVAIVASEPMATLIRQYIDHGQLGDLWKAAVELHGRWQLLAVKPETVAS